MESVLASSLQHNFLKLRTLSIIMLPTSNYHFLIPTSLHMLNKGLSLQS